MVESTPGWGVVTYVIEPTVLFVSLQRAVFHKCAFLCFGVHWQARETHYCEETLSNDFCIRRDLGIDYPPPATDTFYLWKQRRLFTVSIPGEKLMKINATFEQPRPSFDCFCF